MQAQALHRQVAHGAGHGHIHLVFDGAGVAAIAHAQEALAVVGAGWYENNIGPHFANLATEFGKLDVITNQDRDAAVGRVEHAQLVAGITLPFLFFPAGQVNFVLGKHLALGREQVGGVHELAIHDGGVAAAYDVNFPLRCEFLEQLDVARRVVVHVVHGLAQIAGVHEGQQLGGEDFRQQNELGFVVACGLHHKAHLVLKTAPVVNGTQQVLHRCDAHADRLGLKHRRGCRFGFH